ncbi:MAG: hypothetical protein ACKO7M_04275 [Acinetobacter junii]
MNALELYKQIREEITDNAAVEQNSKFINILQKYRKAFNKYPELKSIDPEFEKRIEKLFQSAITTEMLVTQLTDEQMLPIIAPSLFNQPTASLFSEPSKKLFK